MRRLVRQYLGPYWRPIVLVFGLQLIQAIATLLLPWLNADIIDHGIKEGDTAYIVATGAAMLAVTLVQAAASIIAVYFASKTAMAFGRDVRAGIFRRVQSFSLSELNQFGTPSLITRTTNDVQQIQAVMLMALNTLIAAPILAIGGIVLALSADVPLSRVIVVMVPLMGAVIGIVMSRTIPLYQALQLMTDRINRVIRENLVGIRTIRAFDQTAHEERRFDDASRDLTATNLRVQRLFAFMLPSLLLISNVATLAILWLGARRVDDGAMSVGNLTAFLQYVGLIHFSVMIAMLTAAQVPRAAVSAGRIHDVLDTVPSISDPAMSVHPSRSDGAIEFRSVEFRYAGAQEPVLSDISLTIQPGETLALIGGTGSGKSSLINLIARLHDPTMGHVLVDGVDVVDLRRDDLWRRIGLVPQRAFLFAGTVATNLRLGDEHATDDELWHALEIAQARTFVAQMPAGLAAPIDQGGANLSGGQRQRITVARALVRRPEIYLLDDSFSALDAATEALLMDALRRNVPSRTVILVTQRLGTILRADRVAVLDEGRLAGIGTHAELLDGCLAYREIVDSQIADLQVA